MFSTSNKLFSHVPSRKSTLSPNPIFFIFAQVRYKPNSTRVRNASVSVAQSRVNGTVGERPEKLCIPHFGNLAGVCFQSAHPQVVGQNSQPARGMCGKLANACGTDEKGDAWNAKSGQLRDYVAHLFLCEMDAFWHPRCKRRAYAREMVSTCVE